MLSQLFSLSLLVVATGSSVGAGRTVGGGQCIGTNPCYCRFEDGSFLDLSALGRRDGTPRFLNETDSHEISYSWNPCFSFTEGGCANVSICAIRPAFPHDIYIPIGYENTSVFVTNAQDNSLTLKYTSEGNGQTPTKTSHISLVCDPKENGTFTAIGQKTETSLDYYFELRGAMACVRNGPSPTTSKPETSGLSSGDKAAIGVSSAIVLAAVVIFIVVLKQKGKICKGQNYDAIE